MKRILIIEDNKSLREDVYEALKFEGYEVFQTDNGKLGIDYAMQHHPDLIVCDIMMPEMNGFEVLAKLRQQEQSKLIPFIFITSLTDRGHFRTGMDLGADDYITKPFTIKELTSAIKTRLDKYYTSQLGSVIENIEKGINLRMKTLKQRISRQQSHISEISETNEQLNLQLKAKESELFEEVFKTIETSNTLHLLKNQLERELERIDIPEEQRELLNNLLKKIERIGNKKDNWRIFQLKFNQTYPDFVAIITHSFPKLTQLEMTLMSTILFNLNSNQVASLLNISPDSVRKSKYRLKKSLNLGPDENLVSFIHGFKLGK